MLLYQVKWINPDDDDDFAVLGDDLENQVKGKVFTPISFCH